jgi:hypothetical protein
MSPWELRGYATYPQRYGMPQAGTAEELAWARGWNKAQRETIDHSNPTSYSSQNYFEDYDF